MILPCRQYDLFLSADDMFLSRTNDLNASGGLIVVLGFHIDAGHKSGDQDGQVLAVLMWKIVCRDCVRARMGLGIDCAWSEEDTIGLGDSWSCCISETWTSARTSPPSCSRE